MDDVSAAPPLDTDADNTVLSVDELFDVVDTDGSGHISFAEFEAFWRQRLRAMGESTDDEALARARSIFEDLDEDGTGSLRSNKRG
jgi:Ca2+-binding EF-hand superfamily protein